MPHFAPCTQTWRTVGHSKSSPVSAACRARAFAASFKNQVGTAPLEYLIEWRMSLARDALRRGTRSISELAFATDYESESAFSTAFRRMVGASPKQFRDAAHSG
ncbi:helix-turn-helix transcriptional regulator [Streptomyces sp. RTd22]|uniref:helix-turn-helix domain-containing protein n=1 Tax=Streptomyces sp. RTd22 TaxID=1841249 RepID=UPI002D21C19C|nr:helix-turn-helix transcriptional regulator [Streptomyces sp. RTd22]